MNKVFIPYAILCQEDSAYWYALSRKMRDMGNTKAAIIAQAQAYGYSRSARFHLDLEPDMGTFVGLPV